MDLIKTMQSQFTQEMPVFSERQAQPTAYYGHYPSPIITPPPPPPQQQPFVGYSTTGSAYVPPQLQTFSMTALPKPVSGKDAEMHELRAIIRNKIAAKIQEHQAAAAESMERLMEESAKLTENEGRLNDSVSKLRSEMQRIQKAIEDLRRINRETQAPEIDISKLDVEGLMLAQGETSRQLLELSLQEMAIIDCLYAINKAFFDNPNLIGVSAFIKMIRSLAREQFMAKAHIQRIRQLYPVMP